MNVDLIEQTFEHRDLLREATALGCDPAFIFLSTGRRRALGRSQMRSDEAVRSCERGRRAPPTSIGSVIAQITCTMVITCSTCTTCIHPQCPETTVIQESLSNPLYHAFGQIWLFWFESQSTAFGTLPFHLVRQNSDQKGLVTP